MDDPGDSSKEVGQVELELKRLELEEARRKSRAVNRFAGPISPAVIGLLAAAAGGWFQLNQNRDLERDKFEYGILAKATEQPNDDARRSFLRFVLDLGLLERRSASVQKWLNQSAPVPRTVVSDSSTSAPSGPPAFIEITALQLQAIMPTIPEKTAADFAPALSSAMTVNAITTPKRAAAFLANVAYETADLKVLQEVWGPTSLQLKYDPPSSLAKELGNTNQGDGKLFRGRGLIPFGGRTNYGKIGAGIGVDLINHPDQLLDPAVACQAATFWWKSQRLNEAADANDLSLIVRKVNGGDQGIEKRAQLYYRGLKVLSSGG